LEGADAIPGKVVQEGFFDAQAAAAEAKLEVAGELVVGGVAVDDARDGLGSWTAAAVGALSPA